MLGLKDSFRQGPVAALSSSLFTHVISFIVARHSSQVLLLISVITAPSVFFSLFCGDKDLRPQKQSAFSGS